MANTTPADVTHLWRRAAFGINAPGAESRAGTAWTDLVDELVEPAPVWMARTKALDDASYNGLEMYRALAVAGDWLDVMASTTAPGAEKLAWFWHGHFTTSIGKVMWGEGISRQLASLRANAQAPFRTLLGAMVVDGAMSFWLDNVVNFKGAVNENLGRELLELFTVGFGNYTQADVTGATRSLTGHNVDWAGSMLPKFYPEWHDTGQKTVLGSTGNFDANGLCDVLCNATNKVLVARRVVRKLWSAWVYPNPTDTLVNAVAATALGNGFSGKSLMRAVLTHPEFQSATARSAIVRTPVELVIALARVAKLKPSQLNASATLAQTAHHPFLPPNVGGWPPAPQLLSTQSWWQLGPIHANAALLASQATPTKLPKTGTLPPADAATAVLRWAGIVDPAAETVTAMTDYITTVRSWYPASEPIAAAMAATLSPDFAAGGGS